MSTTPTQKAIDAYIELRQAGSNPTDSHGRALRKRQVGEDEQHAAEQGISPLDTIRDLRELFLADQTDTDPQDIGAVHIEVTPNLEEAARGIRAFADRRAARQAAPAAQEEPAPWEEPAVARAGDHTELDALAYAAVEVATLLGEDKKWEHPNLLLSKAADILKATGLPNPGSTRETTGYRDNALEVYARAVNKSMGQDQ